MSKLDKHPSWFKLKVERRELVKQLAPETAVNVLLACFDSSKQVKGQRVYLLSRTLHCLRFFQISKKRGSGICSASETEQREAGRQTINKTVWFRMVAYAAERHRRRTEEETDLREENTDTKRGEPGEEKRKWTFRRTYKRQEVTAHGSTRRKSMVGSLWLRCA